MNNHDKLSTSLPPGLYRAKKAGFTFTVSTLDTSMPLKYLCTRLGLIPIWAVNIPIGSIPKSISTEKLKDDEGMYETMIEVVDTNPLTSRTLRTSLQLREQSLEDRMRESGM